MMKDEFSINLAEENESLGFDLKEQYVAGTSDYNKLKNKPTLNGNEIIGAMEEEDPTVPTWAKSETRPVYTADDVGAMKEGSVTSVSTNELDEIWNSL
jgi:hypothetical protein